MATLTLFVKPLVGDAVALTLPEGFTEDDLARAADLADPEVFPYGHMTFACLDGSKVTDAVADQWIGAMITVPQVEYKGYVVMDEYQTWMSEPVRRYQKRRYDFSLHPAQFVDVHAIREDLISPFYDCTIDLTIYMEVCSDGVVPLHLAKNSIWITMSQDERTSYKQLLHKNDPPCSVEEDLRKIMSVSCPPSSRDLLVYDLQLNPVICSEIADLLAGEAEALEAIQCNA